MAPPRRRAWRPRAAVAAAAALIASPPWLAGRAAAAAAAGAARRGLQPASPGEVHIALAGASALRVSWRDDDAVKPAVFWGNEPGALGSTAPADVSQSYAAADMCQPPANDATKFVAPGTLHHARLDVGGAAVVYYAVGDAANASAPRSPTYATAGGGGRPAQYPFALLAVGDVGTQWPEARNTTARMAEAAAEGGVGLVAHVGDISYATGHSSQWADFMQAIEPLAAVVPYHTTAGNHDTLCELGAGFDTAACKGLGGWIPPEDWIGYLEAGGAGGECGVPYDVRFWMPPPTSVTATATVRRRQGAPRAALVAPRSFPTTADTGQAVQTGSSSPGSDPARGNLYHSVEQGPVHMAFISSEHNVSAQLGWLDADLATVDRERTPFVLFAMHRPYYDSTLAALAPYTIALRNLVEPVLAKHGVDLALHGHVHSYERTCAMLGGKCVDAARGVKYLTVGAGGAPTHAPWLPAPDFIEFRSQGSANKGFARLDVLNATHLRGRFVLAASGEVADEFYIEAFGSRLQRELGR